MFIDNNNDLVKAPHLEQDFSQHEISELQRCETDPIYFMKTYVQVLHPMKGVVPLELYDCQYRIVEGYEKFRFNITLTSRQSGKSLTSNSIITNNGEKVKIKTLIKHTLKEKVVLFLENALIRLSEHIQTTK